MTVYYNEVDPFCLGVLRRRIADGSLPPGDVDDRDVREVKADEIGGYDQWHLFAGIGGFPLGFRMAGLSDDFGPVLTGGPPCQDGSAANYRGLGVDGPNTRLFFEAVRLIVALRPPWILLENSPRLRTRGIDRVLAALEAQDYACWPLVVGAGHLGAPHIRDRMWLVAHADSHGVRPIHTSRRRKWGYLSASNDSDGASADADGLAGNSIRQGVAADDGAEQPAAQRGADRSAADTDGAALRLQPRRSSGAERPDEALAADAVEPDGQGQPDVSEHGQVGGSAVPAVADGQPWPCWNAGPRAHLSMDDGLSDPVAAVKALGNAVVPQVVAEIAIAMHQAEREAA